MQIYIKELLGYRFEDSF